MESLEYWLIHQAVMPKAIDIATTLSDEDAEEQWMAVSDEYKDILLFGRCVSKDQDYWLGQAKDIADRIEHIRDGMVDGTHTPDWRSELLWMMDRTAEAVDKIVDTWMDNIKVQCK